MISGHVRAFEHNGTDWNQMRSDIQGTADADYFGTSVAMSSNGARTAGGAPHAQNNDGVPSGCIRACEHDGTNWNQMGSVLDGKGNHSDLFETSVCFSNDGSRVGSVNGTPGHMHGSYVAVYDFDVGANNWLLIGGFINGKEAGD